MYLKAQNILWATVIHTSGVYIDLHSQTAFCSQLPIASKLHSTDYVTVFISQVQDILHMSSFGSTVGREKSHFCLLTLSSKFSYLL